MAINWKQVGPYATGFATAATLFFAYDQYRLAHDPSSEAENKMYRVLRDISNKDYCIMYRDGTAERTRYTKGITGGYYMEFWKAHSGDTNSSIIHYKTELSDLKPDKNEEFAATYINDHESLREGVYMIEGGAGVFIYEPRSEGRKSGEEAYECSRYDYPAITRVMQGT